MYVKKVTGINKDFMVGADISSYLSLEKSGVVFHDKYGNPGNLFEILKDSGFNYIRLRVWNDPFDENGNGYGAGNCDLSCAIETGKRATAAGLRTKIAFHYSDFWADPGKQMSPKAWRDMDISTRTNALYDYTYESVTALLKAGVDVGIVAVGNENNSTIDGSGMAGVSGRWDTMEQAADLLKLFQAGCDATRKAAKEQNAQNLQVAVHIADPYQTENYLNFADRLSDANIDYDIYGSSYYPFWHGTLENLTDILSQVSKKHNKDVLCVETSYPTTLDDGDGFELYPIKYNENYRYAISPQGAANAYRDVAQAVADVPSQKGLGLFLWEPTWVPVGSPDNWEHNFKLWEEYGSGWAASYGSSYNPQIAGRYGGTGWDNKGMFDFHGYPLPTITVFKDMHEGRDCPITIDVMADSQAEIEYHDELCIEDVMATLPCTALAIYTDNTHKELPVSWDIVPILDALEQMKEKPHVKYLDLTGITCDEGRPHCLLRIAPKNLVQNHSFEDEDMSMWFIDTDYLSRQSKSPKFGDFALGFSRPVPLEANTGIEQTIKIRDSGTYTMEAAITGIAAKQDAKTDCNIYVIKTKKGMEDEDMKDEDTHTVSFELSGYRQWCYPKISGIELSAGDKLTIGVEIRATKGAVGAIDEIYLYKE
ncbi:MAG: glycosyl hydrolase 53 family protein [Defluviitaleaceae bacterium]|nr:glycosyl hydrolase 53 family protein [Defluviitaleaceae bacterium]